MTKSANDYAKHFPGEITLFVRGRLPDHGKRSEKRNLTVAIVGTRKPTEYGERVAYNIAWELAKQGITVISGLAVGIDAAAHRGALDGAKHTVLPRLSSVTSDAAVPTIAVLAGGVDQITPWQNQSLGERILAEGGAIISEYPDGTPVKAFRLLERNRIVSGLADAVIIVEAAARSGTLATARHAMRQGRPIYVVPGRLTDKMSAGCHYLLEQYPEHVRVFTSVKNLLANQSCGSPQALAPDLTAPAPDLTQPDFTPSAHLFRTAPAGTVSRQPVGTGGAHLALALPRSESHLESSSEEASVSRGDWAKSLIKSGATSAEITEQLGISAAELAQIQTELELFG